MIADAERAPISEAMATKHFRKTAGGGKWKVLHGWHIFRHSLASNMASDGVDQRVISAILGHSTVEMERRYRHLLPGKTEHAINALFASGAKACGERLPRGPRREPRGKRAGE